MPDARDQVQLSFRPTPEPAPTAGPSAGRTSTDVGDASKPKPFLQLWFACSNQYVRATKTTDATAYLGRCPKCAKVIRFPVGNGGTDQRSFRVSCTD